jgi:hypothetical protein
MEGSLEGILLFNLIHHKNGIKIQMLLYYPFQTRRNFNSLILKHPMHFMVFLIESCVLEQQPIYLSTMTAIKTTTVIAILDILIKLQKALLITLINLRIT